MTTHLSADHISPAELQLATRNHGLPLEALRWDRTPEGLHYLLVHYDVPVVDGSTWRLTVAGSVERELTLSLDDVKELPARSVAVTMECAGNGRSGLDPRPVSQPWILEAVGTAEWTGAPLRAVIDRARPRGDAVDAVFTGLDRGVEGGVEQQYQRALPLDGAALDEAVLAYEMNGSPLLPQHGRPLRLVVPGWYGMTNVKWLSRIELVPEPFDGYQHTEAYRVRADDDDPGEPTTQILPRSLMVPPGIPDFLTRRRFLAAGPVEIEGRAWSGCAPIVAVEVSDDGGRSWSEAELHTDSDGHVVWRRWTWTWRPAGPGDHELCCRARDAAGNEQPLSSPWNVGGYANNAVQRVAVTVTPPG